MTEETAGAPGEPTCRRLLEPGQAEMAAEGHGLPIECFWYLMRTGEIPVYHLAGGVGSTRWSSPESLRLTRPGAASLGSRGGTMSSRIRIARSGPSQGYPSPESLNLLSVPEAAHYAKVSTQTIRRAIKAGHLKFYRAGRQIRIDEADLVQYLSK